MENVELVRDERGIALVGNGLELRADFTRMLARLRPANLQHELLVRAARVKGLAGKPRIIDATAGFGEDALLLAASGCSVTMLEHNPIIATLLRDALEQARNDERLAEAVSRMVLFEEESVSALRSRAHEADVVYLDPMFPERTKSAAVKKKFQLLHLVEWPCSDEGELFEAALACQPRKIVVKRALKGPYLAGRKPHYSLHGKAVRYDCFAFPAAD